MKIWKECPVYVWIFSFFALFVLMLITMFQFVLWLRSLFGGKFPFDRWLSFCGEFMIDIFLLFMLPYAILTMTLGTWAAGFWTEWLGFLCAYLLGIYPTVRLWKWRTEHESK